MSWQICKKLNSPGINYNACISADGKTFTHTAFSDQTKSRKYSTNHLLLNTSRNNLNQRFEIPPKQELLNLVGSSKDIFTDVGA